MNLRTITDENDLTNFNQGYENAKQSKSSMNNAIQKECVVPKGSRISAKLNQNATQDFSGGRGSKPISVWDQIQQHDAELYKKEQEEKRRLKKMEQQ